MIPIPAYPLFLLAAAAAAIPVVLHLISRQKAKDLPFPTLRFLRISAEKTRRRKRIQDILLMLLRMAVLMLIAVGLSELRVTELPSPFGRGETSAVAIVLDNSASMGTVDEGRVRFRTALGAAEQILDELHRGDQVALFLTGGPRFPEEGKFDPTQEKVHQLLNQWIVAPAETSGVSYEQADLGLKVARARKLLADSDAENKQIYVLTDLQESCWETSLSLRERAGVRGQQDKASTGGDPLPEGKGTPIPVIIVDCNRTPKPNVAIQGVTLEAAVPVAGLPVTANVDVFNASPASQQRHLELYIDGAKVASSSVLNIPAETNVKHEFTFTFRTGGLHRGEVQLVGEDGLKLDDRRFFTMEVNREIPVAVVKPRRHEIAYMEDTFYLQRALAPDEADGWAIRTTPLVAADLATVPPAARDAVPPAARDAVPLSGYQVIYCVNLPAADAATARRLSDYVAGGGNLVWICGDNVATEAYNHINEQAGGTLLPAPLVDVRMPQPGDDRDSWNVTFLDKRHPALSQLVEPASLYQSVLVYKHVRIDADAAPEARVLARLDDGEPLLVQRDVQRGKVLLLGTSVHVGWSNLPLRPIFLPLVARLTFDLAGGERTRYRGLAGTPLVFPLEDAAAPVTVEIVPPGGQSLRLPTAADPDGRQIFRYADTHEVGVYRLQPLAGPRTRPVAYSVNIDPDEADVTKIDREDLAKLFGPTPLIFADDPADLSSTFDRLHEGKNLWELFVWFVLFALVFETYLSNRLTPKQQQPEDQLPPPGMRRLARRGRGVA